MIVENLDQLNLSNNSVIVVGSGPSAIAVALELEHNKISSLIIEAGDEKYNHTSQKSYKGEIVGDSIGNLTHNRLRQFGGTSGHWGGWCRPLEEYDFKNWDIKAKDLKDYSDKTCKILEIKNQFKNSKLNKYFNQIQFQYSKVRFADKYKDHIRKSNKINLILNTQVSHFIGANNITDHVVCFSKGKEYKIKSKYFILGCGGVENSRILLWTKEKNNNFINPNSPIGKYWMTHPWIIGGYGVLKKTKIKEILKEEFLNYDGPIHIATSERIGLEKNILAGHAYINAIEDTKLHREIIKDLLCVAPKFGKKIARKIFSKDLKCGNIFLNLEEEAKESNQIQLHNKIRDNLNIPVTKLFYTQSRSTVEKAKIILEEFGNFCRKNNLGRVAMSEDIYKLLPYKSLGAAHHMGGTRMGNNASNSVVNKDLMLHDNKNLYIAGSSNFVSGGYSNPTYTIVQLSLRIANNIVNKIKENI